MSSTSSLYPVHPECFTTFKDFKIRHKYKWVLFDIKESEDGSKEHIVVSTESDKTKKLDDFVKVLPEAGCMFAVYEHEYAFEDGRKSNKLFFINWNPPGANMQRQMDYLTGRPSLRSICDGCSDVAAASHSDIMTGVLKTREHDSEEEDNDDWMN